MLISREYGTIFCSLDLRWHDGLDRESHSHTSVVLSRSTVEESDVALVVALQYLRKDRAAHLRDIVGQVGGRIRLGHEWTLADAEAAERIAVVGNHVRADVVSAKQGQEEEDVD